MLRPPRRSALSISAINGMKINLVLRLSPRANCLIRTTTRCWEKPTKSLIWTTLLNDLNFPLAQKIHVQFRR